MEWFIFYPYYIIYKLTNYVYTLSALLKYSNFQNISYIGK